MCDVVGADTHHFVPYVANGSNRSISLPRATAILPVKPPVNIPKKSPVEEEDLCPVIKNPDRPANQDLDIKDEDLRPVIDNPEGPENHDSDFEEEGLRPLVELPSFSITFRDECLCMRQVHSSQFEYHLSILFTTFSHTLYYSYHFITQ